MDQPLTMTLGSISFRSDAGSATATGEPFERGAPVVRHGRCVAVAGAGRFLCLALAIALGGCRDQRSGPPERASAQSIAAGARSAAGEVGKQATGTVAELLPGPGEHRLQPHWIGAAQPDTTRLLEVIGSGNVVLSLRDSTEEAFAEQALVERHGGIFLRHPVSGDALRAPRFRTELFALLDSLGQSGAAVYIHCHSGNRVGAVWALYLGERRGMHADDALARGAAAGMGSLAPVVAAILTHAKPAAPRHDEQDDAERDFGC